MTDVDEPQEERFRCACSHEAHTLSFEWHPWDPDRALFLSVFLDEHVPFHRRLWLAFKYAFRLGDPCPFGHWDEWIMRPEDAARLRALLDRFSPKETSQPLPPVGQIVPSPEDLVMFTDDLRQVVEKISLAPSCGLLGRLGKPTVKPLSFLRGEERLGPGPVKVVGSVIVGWEVEWPFDKPSVDGKGEFAASFNVYVAHGSRRGRVLEIVLERMLLVAQHEVREAFTYGAERPFDPHQVRA